MTGHIPPFALKWLQVVLAVILMALAWRVANGTGAMALLADLHPAWVGAALAALTVQTVLSALRWRLTAGQLDIQIDRRTAIQEYYLAQIINQALPGGLLGDAGRAMRARAQAGLLPSVQSVVFERLAGQIALFVFFAATALLSLALPGWLDWPRTHLPPLLALIVTGAVALLGFWRAELWPKRAARYFRTPCLHALAAPEVRTRQITMSVGTALCNIAAFTCCAHAVGVGLSPVAALVLVPLVLLSMLLPLTISGWGIREGAAMAVLPIAGATMAEAFAASVIFGFAMLAASLPGFVALRMTSSVKPMRS